MCIFFIILLIPAITQAEVILNGRPMAKNIDIAYEIRQEFGQTVGDNLFHTFETFNLYEGETAHFSGQDHIQNIITRVIGGEASFIDGTLRSSIPNADFYFLNPYGAVIGEHAQLKTLGSFHLSTADYIKLADNGEFHARFPERDILSVAPITQFGFLTDKPAPITAIGAGEIPQEIAQTFYDDTNKFLFEKTRFQLPEQQTMSLIGGEININGGYFYKTDDERLQGQNTLLPAMYFPSGRFNLVSVGSSGEVSLQDKGIQLTGFSQLADTTLNDIHIANVGKDGDVFIYAEQLHFNNSGISSDDYLAKGDAGSVSIQTRSDVNFDHVFLNSDASSEGNAGSILINSQGDVNFVDTELHSDSFGVGEGDSGNIEVQSQGDINFTNSNLYFDNLGEGKAGDVFIKSGADINFDNVHISSSVTGIGSSGNINIESQGDTNFYYLYLYSNAYGGSAGELFLDSRKDLNITHSRLAFDSFGIGDAGESYLHSQGNINFTDAYISSNTYGAGKAGDITMTSQEDINFIKNSYLFSVTYEQGHAGNISLIADNLNFTNTTSVSSTSFGAKNTQGGDAGNITVRVNDRLRIAGNKQDDNGLPNGIFSNSSAQAVHRIAGHGGNIDIETSKLLLIDGGQIAVTSTAQQNATSQQGGDISIKADEISLIGVNLHGENEYGFGSGIYASSIGSTDNTGGAGHINITAQRMLIKEGAVIESSTNSYADAGNINIELTEQLEISGDASQAKLYEPGEIQKAYLNNYIPDNYNESTSGIFSSSISKTEKAGKGGEITIRSPQISLSNQATISTSSQGGQDAGDIELFVKQLILNDQAHISSESSLKNDIEGYAVATPQLNVGDMVEVLSSSRGGTVTLRYIATETGFNPIHPIFHVENETDLESIQRAKHGEIALVTSSQQRFMFDNEKNWIPLFDTEGIAQNLDEDSTVFDELQSKFFKTQQDIPYPEGSLFLVKTKAGNQLYAYEITTYKYPNQTSYQGSLEKLNHYLINDVNELNELERNYDLITGNTAIVKNINSEEYYYSGNEWIHIGRKQQIDSVGALDSVQRSEPGFTFLNLDNGSELIFTGTNWIPLTSRTIVDTEQQRDTLSAQNGDMVTIRGAATNFFYNNSEWNKQAKGGNAGLIHIEAETIQLFNHSEITTESISAGGGAINLNITHQLFLPQNSQITTSVQHGILNGGDLSITTPTFTILDQGNILAQAYEGNGGNIQITTSGYFVSPYSNISASSQFGLDGHIHIDALGSLNNEALGALPNSFFNTDINFKPSCNTDDGSSFSLTPNVGIANVALDWRSAHEW
ncbi:filamentous hemagglutinin N-terminal domain-containing protein [Candidatus Albibeggiatoa sp. nov. BB20]|uniref:two-partner secretion domain-containing protein n=1 Tax=Candidatus Albibeggiatoa sp. nov. BB20 TaxID=3162723 RepID=UPI003365A844